MTTVIKNYKLVGGLQYKRLRTADALHYHKPDGFRLTDIVNAARHKFMKNFTKF